MTTTDKPKPLGRPRKSADAPRSPYTMTARATAQRVKAGASGTGDAKRRAQAHYQRLLILAALYRQGRNAAQIGKLSAGNGTIESEKKSLPAQSPETMNTNQGHALTS